MFDNSVWKEERGCFANQITCHSRRLQAPQRHVRERWELDGGLLDEDIIRLRELEGKAWGDSEGGGYIIGMEGE